MKRYAFIYNPAAGKGKAKKRADLEKRIQQLPKAKLFCSQQKGDIPDLVDKLLPEYDVFVACGGDGTARELGSKLVHTQKEMGIIPIGTGNDLCKTLKIPTDLDRSFKLLLNRKPTKIDVGRCNDFLFLNTLGFGFDGLTNRYAEKMRRLPSFLRYVTAALKATVNQHEFSVTEGAEEMTTKQLMLTFANGRVEGGLFWIAPDASVTDGKLHLISIQPVKKWLIPLLLPLFLFKKASWIPYVRSRKIESTTIQIENKLAIHADGEVINTNQTKFSIQLIPSGLRVICGL